MDIISNIKMNDNIVDHNLYILDPLSCIVKLAILSKKPIGTKIFVHNNIIYIQEVGLFQGFCRAFINVTNKTDLKYLYNPIYYACETFMSEEFIKTHIGISKLFISAREGLKCLTETYKNCSIIQLCLFYYIQIMSNYIDKHYNKNLFMDDIMTIYYETDKIKKLNNNWTDKNIKVILDIIDYLEQNNQEETINNVETLETIIKQHDKNYSKIISDNNHAKIISDNNV